MLPLLCILLFTATTTFSLKPMESPDKSEKLSKKRKNLKKRSSESSISKQKTNNYILPEHPFISAAESQNHLIMTSYLRNPYFNPNIYNKLHNTAPHYSALVKDYVGLQLLLNDPRIDFSKRNIEQKTARELIKGDDANDIEMRHKIFARVTLDIVTKQECTSIQSKYSGFISPTTLGDTIQSIKTKIIATEMKNHAEDLPTSACFPDYATDEFMEKKVYFHITDTTQ